MAGGTKILSLTEVTTPVAGMAIGIADSGTTNKYITIINANKIWLGNIDAQANDLSNFGFLESSATNPAQVGEIRFGLTDSIQWRNAANNDENFIDMTSDTWRFVFGAAVRYTLASGNFDTNTASITGPNVITMDGSTVEKIFTLQRNVSLSDDSVIGTIEFESLDGGGPTLDNYASIQGIMESDVDTAEEGGIRFNVMHLGFSPIALFRINDAGSGNVHCGTTFDLEGNDVDNILNLIHDLSTSGTDIDFGEEELQEISISANTTFTGTGYAIGKSKSVKITTDGTLRTLTFPSGWVFVGTKPADQAASKTGILSLTSFTAAEAGVVCSYAVEA